MSKEQKFGTIRYVPFEECGVYDGVEMMVNSSVTDFSQENGKPTEITSMQVLPCNMLASYENGIVTLSVRGDEAFAVSVRIDEIMALLQASVLKAIDQRTQNKGKTN